jgi:Arc/MetJ-type ribon-helix-helix transcriptional regulator
MKSGRYKSEDDLLRDALDALASESEELEAIRAALAEWQDGDPGVSLDDAFESIRRHHQASGEG